MLVVDSHIKHIGIRYLNIDQNIDINILDISSNLE